MAAVKRKRPEKRRSSHTALASGTSLRTSASLVRELDGHRDELAAQNVELRRANAELMTATERYAELYDGAPSAYCTIDSEGMILEANLAAADLLDVPRNILFGRSFDELVSAASRDAFRTFRRRVLEQAGRPSHETLLAMGSRRVPVRIEAARLASTVSPGPQCLLCITDETERRYLEQERRSLDARYAEAQRIESVGALASGIAHDFNNTLAVVLMHADLVLLDDAEPDRMHRALEEIREAAARAAELSRQMLVFAGRGRGRMGAVDVSSLVNSMSGLLGSSTSKDVELSYELAEGLPAVMGEGELIQQVVWNLVVNASEAIMPGAGRVIVRTRAEMTTGGAGVPRGANVIIEVIDDGIGMDDATKSRAFDPFFSTKRAGRGLGLAVVHRNVRIHGGSVVLDSRMNVGTTCRVFLPVGTERTEAQPANDTARESKKEAAWRGSGVVLVVDDEPDVREATGMVLERVGFQVCYARDGLEALALVRRPPGPLAAVLLDLLMPRLDGHATLAELKRIAPGLPVLVTSGAATAGLEDQLAAADGFLPKPFSLESLIQAMQRTLSRSR